MIRILSWNVNGLRARAKAGFADTIKELDPDIVCIQETRAKPEQLPGLFMLNYEGFFSVHNKPGYAGATTYVRKHPDNQYNILAHLTDFPDGDEPGRVSILDFPDFVLINAYVPNSGMRLEKIDHRIAWEERLFNYIRIMNKPTILCGDLNVAPEPRDVNVKGIQAGTSVAERKAFQNLLSLGMVDVWREQNPNTDKYTWFSYYADAVARNKGMRLDHFVVTKSLFPHFSTCAIINDPKLVAGSDHLPVIVELHP